MTPTKDAVPQEYADFIGRQEKRTDRLDSHRIANLAALLDESLNALAPGRRLPPLSHWLYFNRWAPQSELGDDGHPKRGGFMPPVPLPRRMFAGGRLEFRDTLVLDEEAERVTTITSIERKTGSSGELVFVTVRHEISGPRGVAIVEEQDIVYRGDTPPSAAQAPKPAAKAEGKAVPSDAVISRVSVNPVMLFRFSALTDNGHRIHYDYPYVTKVEGYPGLVVHGPYQAVLLADLLRRNIPGRVASYRFQARRPLFDTAPFECVAWRENDGISLMTRDLEGRACMSAQARIES